jgi:adenine-specific DNA-methyltransferase
MAMLDFKGKTFVQNYYMSVKYHQLIPVKEKSLTDKVSLNDNLIIHGDNLKALKALLPNYADKVKCIYIDPPYNTGNENWVYNDNVNSPIMKEWLGKVVDREDLTRHDKWLCMMMPRLRLLKELLSEDGVIFISIDDNEVHHLRMLMDEIFNEENFIASIVWQRIVPPRSGAKHISTNHDYILVYAKNNTLLSINLAERTSEQLKRYRNSDDDPRGDWAPDNLAARNYYSKGIYEITTPSGRIVSGPPKGSYWRVSKEKFLELDKDNRIWWGENGSNVPTMKRFLSEIQEGVTITSWWDQKISGDTAMSKKEIKVIFEDEEPFITPKPVKLIKKLLQAITNENSIILDSFAGSGTTAHAVLDLNKEDDGNRKFILIECEDYADNITAERVRRVIKGVPNAKDEKLKEGLGGTFSYFELGEPIDIEKLLKGDGLPPYLELARYVFYTATGEEFDSTKIDENTGFIGESKDYEVYLFYKPDIDYLKTTALTLDRAKSFGPYRGKKRLVFAPMRYLDQEYLTKYNLEYCQLPYEIYRSRS